MIIRLETFTHGLVTTSILIQAGPTSCLWLAPSQPSVVTRELSILVSTAPPPTLSALCRQKDGERSRGVQTLGRERRLELSRCKGSVVSRTARCRGKLGLCWINVTSNTLMFKLWNHGFNPGACLCFDSSCCLAKFFLYSVSSPLYCKITMVVKLWSAWNTAAHHLLVNTQYS